MDRFLLLDTNFLALAIVDKFESVIWADRYWEYSDFELYLPGTKENIDLFKIGRYVHSTASENLMIIEDVLVETDFETGSHLTVTGRSLESILDRRIIWQQTTYNGTLWQAIQKFLNENAINPSIAARKIPDLSFQVPTDPAVTSLKYDGQVTGTNLYELIQALCESNNIGFKILLDANNKFVFSLYAGTDHSYDQSTNPYVVFATKFDNLISTNSLESKKPEKNVGLGAGEGEGLDRRTIAVGTASGLERREMYVDARDISSNDGEIPAAEYNAMLTQRVNEYLADNKKVQSYECTVDPSRSFVFNVDYFLGDVVSVFDDFGNEQRSRILEMVSTTDLSGSITIPTFSIIEKD